MAARRESSPDAAGGRTRLHACASSRSAKTWPARFVGRADLNARGHRGGAPAGGIAVRRRMGEQHRHIRTHPMERIQKRGVAH